MAQLKQLLDKEQFICLDLLRDPVAIPCGHSYCMGCINLYWKNNDPHATFCCPQCRQSFSLNMPILKPILNMNTILADVVEKMKVLVQPAVSWSAAHKVASEVECDFCTETREKAVKSCLVCLASYCKIHLQPHYQSLALKKHKLVEVSGHLQEKICPQHSKLLEIYCQTDQQCICLLCVIDGHKGHETVLAASESARQQEQLGLVRRKFKGKIHTKEKELLELRQAVDTLKISVNSTMENSDQIFDEFVQAVKKRSQEVRGLIQDQEKMAVSLLEKLEQEITELKEQDNKLEHLLHTDDHVHVLQTHRLISAPFGSTDVLSISIASLSDLGNVTNAVAALRTRLEGVFKVEWPKIVRSASTVKILQSPLPKIRAEFLYYSSQLALDPHSAHRELNVSPDRRTVSVRAREHSWPDQPERFDYWCQVLGSEGLLGCCYWEAEWSGMGITIAMAYKDLARKGDGNDSHFGRNIISWSLFCSRKGYAFWHNNAVTRIPGPSSSRIGVYLDHSGGTLAFYSVSESMKLLHKVHTAFTQPLYPGLEFTCYGVSVTLSQME
ncbi:tripartite motif-containing protein 16 [Astyanax mexicanus]|uniref:tripartite motif-containing protein 16 n=1 Tax=Astyanax mexicanus TaxID=7994 RepID=UPI0020CAD87C|nr:tripartite motif-containing protein 16 [Astyanax mexicanus]